MPSTRSTPRSARHGQGFDVETEAVVQVSVPIVDGDRAVVAWWAAVREDDDQGTLAGTSILRFDAEGLVVEQWDTFNQSDTRQCAPDGHGPFGTP